MTTTPPLRETIPQARENLPAAAVLLGAGVVFLMQGFLWRVVWRAQQSLLPPGTTNQNLAMSTLTLPALQTVACTLLLVPWALLCDRFGPRLSYTGGMLLWALGALAGHWAGSTEFLLVTYAIQAAGVAAILPAALAVLTASQPQRGGFLTGLIVAFPALLQLPGSLIADLLAQSLDWRAALVLVPVVAVVPLLLGWFALPSGPAKAAEPNDAPVSPRPVTTGRVVAQTLLLGAVLLGLRIHLELAFAAHYSPLIVSDGAGYSRTHSGLLDFPFAAGLAAGLVAGALLAGRREDTWMAWSVTTIGVAVTSIPLLPIDIATPASAVLVSAGLGFGLSGRLVALLNLAARNRIARAAAVFQMTQNLGYAVGLGLPLALVAGLGGAATQDVRGNLFLGCSLVLLAAGLLLAVVSRTRAAPSRQP